MGADFMKYLGIVAGLVFVYLVVKNGQATQGVLKTLSGVNTNAILALQGNGQFSTL